MWPLWLFHSLQQKYYSKLYCFHTSAFSINFLTNVILFLLALLFTLLVFSTVGLIIFSRILSQLCQNIFKKWFSSIASNLKVLVKLSSLSCYGVTALTGTPSTATNLSNMFVWESFHLQHLHNECKTVNFTVLLIRLLLPQCKQCTFTRLTILNYFQICRKL